MTYLILGLRYYFLEALCTVIIPAAADYKFAYADKSGIGCTVSELE